MLKCAHVVVDEDGENRADKTMSALRVPSQEGENDEECCDRPVEGRCGSQRQHAFVVETLQQLNNDAGQDHHECENG